MSKIVGKTALVTGANRGIGRAFVAGLLEAGAAKVYATARKPETLKDLVAEAGGRVEALALDVTKPEMIAAVAKKSDVALLVNNAGIAGFASFLNAPSIDGARAEMETNYIAPLNMARAFAPVLKANGGGAIINISSIAGHVNFPVLGTYSASKAAVHSLTQGLRAELAEQGTQVVGVYPGPVDTDMAAQFDADKVAPLEVVKTILAALEKGEESVYPDPVSEQIYGQILADPLAVEKMIGQTYLPG